MNDDDTPVGADSSRPPPIYRPANPYPDYFVHHHNAWIRCADPLTVAQLEHVTGTLETSCTTAFTTVLMTIRSHYDILIRRHNFVLINKE